jgi:NAD-dependent SIR2 family protein deacetylase
MGVDSGLPDFRGDQGFWQAYPPLARLGLRFAEMANPRWFRSDPTLAWGFYGHRLNLYRATVPHAGFRRLHEIATNMPGGLFAFTSNVDGHFQAAGFDADHVCEVHGSIRHLQCLDPACDAGIWPAPATAIAVDPATMRAHGPLPACPRCGNLARPNILMFDDGAWREARSETQEHRLQGWLRAQTGRRLVIVEIGAGLAVPTVRRFSQRLAAARPDTHLVRINPRDPGGPAGTISLALGALAALAALKL